MMKPWVFDNFFWTFILLLYFSYKKKFRNFEWRSGSAGSFGSNPHPHWTPFNIFNPWAWYLHGRWFLLEFGWKIPWNIRSVWVSYATSVCGGRAPRAIQFWIFQGGTNMNAKLKKLGPWSHCETIGIVYTVVIFFEWLWLPMMINRIIYVHSNAFQHAKVSSQQKIEVLIYYLPASNIFPKLFQIMINKNMLFLSHGQMGTLLSKEVSTSTSVTSRTDGPKNSLGSISSP